VRTWAFPINRTCRHGRGGMQGTRHHDRKRAAKGCRQPDGIFRPSQGVARYPHGFLFSTASLAATRGKRSAVGREEAGCAASLFVDLIEPCRGLLGNVDCLGGIRECSAGNIQEEPVRVRAGIVAGRSGRMWAWTRTRMFPRAPKSLTDSRDESPRHRSCSTPRSLAPSCSLVESWAVLLNNSLGATNCPGLWPPAW
jgi:hypothetical protein